MDTSAEQMNKMFAQNFDFDEAPDRLGTGSVKWDSPMPQGCIPMWVADMDFKTAPAIIQALERRVAHGIFGYERVPDEYYRATIDWFASRHGLALERDWFIYTIGVVPALSAIIRALTSPGDKVIAQTPVYNCFFSSIRNNGCELLENPLVYADRTYRMDFEGLERCCADPRAKLLLLCNPHNPACRVWTREELERVAEICGRHGVVVVSDEIHCELTFDGHEYTPFASLSARARDMSVTCASPSKAFNIAGLQIANIFCSDPARRALIDKAINVNEVCDVSPLGVEALIAAYTKGGPWLEALKQYLWGNYRMLEESFRHVAPEFPVTRLEGTYLVWVNCDVLGIDSVEIERILKEKYNVWVNPGEMYGDHGSFIRINIACPRTRLWEGLNRILTGLTDLSPKR